MQRLKSIKSLEYIEQSCATCSFQESAESFFLGGEELHVQKKNFFLGFVCLSGRTERTPSPLNTQVLASPAFFT